MIFVKSQCTYGLPPPLEHASSSDGIISFSQSDGSTEYSQSDESS